MNISWGSIRKWFAALIVLAVAAFFGFVGLVGGNWLMLLIGAGIAGGWWYFEYVYSKPADPV
jgi:hypothetical protein